MGGVGKTFALAITSVSGALTIAILFAWMGPRAENVPPPVAVLFDERQVRQIYDYMSPAVIEVVMDNRVADAYAQTGFGSGFLIDTEGHIVTNNHVVEGTDRVRVRFLKGATTEASVLGRYPASDLALLKVDPDVVTDIDPVQLGDSAMVEPGQLAIAIGSPFQMEGTVTAGIISGVDRSLPTDLGRSIAAVIQTNALIGPGNSGGPLLNSAGQAVGINTARFVPAAAESQQRAGFAVPANNLTRVLPMLKERRVVRPPWLGVSVATTDALLNEQAESSVNPGVFVTGVTADSPAHRAGIVPSPTRLDRPGSLTRVEEIGDMIVAVAGVPVRSVSDPVSQLDKHQPGDEIILTVLREDAEVPVQVTLGQWPEQQKVQATSDSNRQEFPDFSERVCQKSGSPPLARGELEGGQSTPPDLPLVRGGTLNTGSEESRIPDDDWNVTIAALPLSSSLSSSLVVNPHR